MPTIHFTRTDATVDAPSGGRLAELCERHPRAGIPFSCRDANCGTCRVEVIEGERFCDAPDADEARLLARLGSKPGVRLGCKLTVVAGSGLLRLRALG